MTELFCLRKNGLEEVTYEVPALEPILKDTLGILIFQESSLRIAKELAGFNLQEADTLRRSIGKKSTELMAKVKKMFLEKAKEKGIITEEEAIIVFDNIEKSQKYQFNASHSYSYAIDCYWTAHAKAHFPLQFYTSYLCLAQEKQDPQAEIAGLINEAKAFNIQVRPPCFTTLEPHFHPSGANEIVFGFTDMKGVGERSFNKLVEAVAATEVELGKPSTTLTWYEFLIHLTPKIDSTLVRRMIEVGGLRHFGLERLHLLHEFESWRDLNDKEQEFISRLNEVTCLTNAIELLLSRVIGHTKGSKKSPPHPKYAVTEGRREKVKAILTLLKNPPSPLIDQPYWIAKKEEEALGIPLTCSNVGTSTNDERVNTTCRQMREGKRNKQNIILGVEVVSCHEHQIKNGDNRGATMAFLEVSDDTGSLDDVVIFNQSWEKYGHLLNREKVVVALHGYIDKNKGSFVVDKVWEM